MKACYDYTLVHPAQIYQNIFDMLEEVKGNVLLLGETGASLYWALGFIDRADSITIAGFNADELNELLETVEHFNVEEFNKNHFPIINYLTKKGALSPDYASRLLSKIKDIVLFDDIGYTYDAIVSIEALQQVTSQDAYVQRMKTVVNTLEPQGIVYGVDMVFEPENAKGEVYLAHQGYISSNDALVRLAANSCQAKVSLQTISPTYIKHIDAFLLFKVCK